MLYVGHGSGGPAHTLVNDQKMYLELLDQYVASAMQDDQGVSAEEAEDIV